MASAHLPRRILSPLEDWLARLKRAKTSGLVQKILDEYSPSPDTPDWDDDDAPSVVDLFVIEECSLIDRLLHDYEVRKALSNRLQQSESRDDYDLVAVQCMMLLAHASWVANGYPISAVRTTTPSGEDRSVYRDDLRATAELAKKLRKSVATLKLPELLSGKMNGLKACTLDQLTAGLDELQSLLKIQANDMNTQISTARQTRGKHTRRYPLIDQLLLDSSCLGNTDRKGCVLPDFELVSAVLQFFDCDVSVSESTLRARWKKIVAR